MVTVVTVVQKMLLNYMDLGIEIWRREIPQKITDVLFADYPTYGMFNCNSGTAARLKLIFYF